MQETNPITKEFIYKFLQEAQSHSGLPYWNRISVGLALSLSNIDIKDDLQDYLLDGLLNTYMIITHRHYMQNKTWKSYDW